MAKGAFSTEVRSIIKDRSGGWCERCSLPLPKGGQVHHRRPRGMGGTVDDSTIAGASNGVWVHPSCHVAVESNREAAYKSGWLVRGALHPVTVPIFRWGRWVLLDDDGNVIPVELPDEHELRQARGSRRSS
jgi:hypothetical protein